MASREPRLVDRVFGEFFGIPPRMLLRPGVSVVPHAALGDWIGAWVFRREETLVISVPARMAGAMRARLRGLDVGRVQEPDGIEALFGSGVEAVVGPSFWGFVEPADFVPFRPDAAGPVRPDERLQVEAFALDVDAGDWEAAGIRSADPHLCVSRAGDRIAAVAGWRSWEQDAGDPGVITHPAHRGKGHGTAATSAVVGRALQRGELALYQTLWENTRALAIARTLGFEEYATNVAVRLHY